MSQGTAVADFLKTVEKKCSECGQPYQGIAIVPTTRCSKCVTAEVEAAEREMREQPLRDREARTVASIPPRYQWATFEAPELVDRVKGDPMVITRATLALEAFSVVIQGESGMGKTSLACALLRARSARSRLRGMFTTAFALAKARAEHRLGLGEAPVVEEAIKAPLLVLDELGAEYAKNTAIHEVIHDRYEQERPTIYTTGFKLVDIAERYGDGIARRIFEGAQLIEIAHVQPELDLGGAS